MKLQDHFPYDSNIANLNDNYREIEKDGAFFINSPCVMADDKYIKKGDVFLLFGSPLECGTDLSWVILVDAFYQYGYIHLIVIDKNTQESRTISHALMSNECSFRLIDINHFINTVIDECRYKK